MIKTEKLSMLFTTEEVQTKALNEVTLHVEQGEFVAIMGPSGCGKSTLLNILGTLDSPTSGSYFFEGKQVDKMNENQLTALRKNNLGFIFQSFNLIDELTVYENVELPLVYMGIKTAQRKEKVNKVLEKVNLLHRANHYPQQLSGGQQQRVAIAQQKLFTDITPEEWQRMLDVNLTGAFNLCQLALPGMIRRKAGRILTVSSMWGQTGGSCEVHYSAAKAGLIGLTKALAKEEGPSGITVNCVAPGVIDTDMMASFTAEDKAALAEETPVGRLGTAEEVAKLLLYLAGEDAGYITGQVFGVNGGLVI